MNPCNCLTIASIKTQDSTGSWIVPTPLTPFRRQPLPSLGAAAAVDFFSVLSQCLLWNALKRAHTLLFGVWPFSLSAMHLPLCYLLVFDATESERMSIRCFSVCRPPFIAVSATQ